MRRGLATLAAILLAGCAGGDSGATANESATVVRVIDGDTVELDSGDRVRLVQIDTPEPGEDECYAEQASAELERLLPPGAAVRLEADPELDDTDSYGRLLRYIHRDGANLNLELVRRGAAAPWFFEGDRGRYADDLLAAAVTAQAEARGLWSACPGTALDPERGVETGTR